MSHVDGDDDGVGYGVYGKSDGSGVYGEGNIGLVCRAKARRALVWLAAAATALVWLA